MWWSRGNLVPGQVKGNTWTAIAAAVASGDVVFIHELSFALHCSWVPCGQVFPWLAFFRQFLGLLKPFTPLKTTDHYKWSVHRPKVCKPSTLAALYSLGSQSSILWNLHRGPIHHNTHWDFPQIVPDRLWRFCILGFKLRDLCRFLKFLHSQQKIQPLAVASFLDDVYLKPPRIQWVM